MHTDFSLSCPRPLWNLSRQFFDYSIPFSRVIPVEMHDGVEVSMDTLLWITPCSASTPHPNLFSLAQFSPAATNANLHIHFYEAITILPVFRILIVYFWSSPICDPFSL